MGSYYLRKSVWISAETERAGGTNCRIRALALPPYRYRLHLGSASQSDIQWRRIIGSSRMQHVLGVVRCACACKYPGARGKMRSSDEGLDLSELEPHRNTGVCASSRPGVLERQLADLAGSLPAGIRESLPSIDNTPRARRRSTTLCEARKFAVIARYRRF